MRSFILVAAFLLSAAPSHAALPFRCEAEGSTWRVTGTMSRKANCSVVCILTDARGDQDKATCSFSTPPDAQAASLCEGFLLDRHWTAATMVSGQCGFATP